jgi:hypothetical protein
MLFAATLSAQACAPPSPHEGAPPETVASADGEDPMRASTASHELLTPNPAASRESHQLEVAPPCAGECMRDEALLGIPIHLPPLRPVKHTRGSNSQMALPNNLALADVDDDGLSDFLQYSENRIFVSHTDYQKTGVLHLYLNRPIQRIITGDFNGDGYDNVCAISDWGALQCYGISTDKKALWWWFTQGSFVAANEDSIVGDFNGDGKDDVLVYNRGNGSLRMYTRLSSGFFGAMPSFALGNLTPEQTTGIQWRAGDFNGDGRTDLMAVQPNGQIVYYASVFDGTNNTFWWAFTTVGGLVGSRDQVSVAKIDNDNNDDIVIHNIDSGSNRFLQMQYNGGNPPAITNVSQGQINTSGNSGLFWGFAKGLLNEPGSQRDDAFVFLNGPQMFVRSDARWDGSQLTYWWAYTQYAPNNHYGWAPFTGKPWLIVKCKLNDRSDEPQNATFFRQLFTSDGWDGMVAFWRDLSFGSWDLTGNSLDDSWVTMSQTYAQVAALSRQQKAQTCFSDAGKSLSGYANGIALFNVTIDSGTQGNVVLDPGAWNVTFAGHEMGHGFGYDHSFDDLPTSHDPNDDGRPGAYGDPQDIMSAMLVNTFNNHQGVAAGPEMNAPYRTLSNFIPAQRTTVLTIDPTTRHSGTYDLAALEKPESNGALVIHIGSAGNNNDYYTVEYRQAVQWDQALPQEGIMIHHMLFGKSYLQTDNQTYRAGRPAGNVWSGPAGVVKVTVNSLNPTAGTASVTINY